MRSIILVVAFVALMSCTQEEFQRIGCIDTTKGVVIIKSNVGSALDGMDYEICTSFDSPNCDKYNKIIALRPFGLRVNVSDDVVTINQFGGSVESFVSDANGLINPSYKNSMPIELFYTSNGKEVGMIFLINGKSTTPQTCR